MMKCARVFVGIEAFRAKLRLDLKDILTFGELSSAALFAGAKSAGSG